MSGLLGGVAIAVLCGTSASAAEKLVVSTWGGDWQDMIADTIGKKFTETTGAEVEFITGGTIDRLNQAQLAAGNPESDVTFTTSHVGWLYKTGGLYETLDLQRIPNAANLFKEGQISDSHIGVWSYVYPIVYRKDLLPDAKFESWQDLWKPEYKDMIALQDFDPSEIITVAAILSGGDASNWEVGQQKLLELKPNIKAYYSSDAASEQLMSTGETPIQVMLSMNALHQLDEDRPLGVVIPKEGAVMGIDTLGVMKGSKNVDLAYQFINAALDPEVQAQIVRRKKGGPMVSGVKVEPEIANLPGVFMTAEDWRNGAIVIDHKLRSEKLSEWRTWFSEKMMAQ
ncbi:ABC transporter substrate-binding protein [Salmonella enterica subsp. enterica]|nr:ABC transporter substrate-binding protein [Salmonella enterica subsp. enterica serovar Enteritidis]